MIRTKNKTPSNKKKIKTLYLPVDDVPLMTLITGNGGVLASGTVSSSFFFID